jgi:hypothetical protein
VAGIASSAARLAAQRVETRLVPGGDELSRAAIASQPIPKAKDINFLLSELHGNAENAGISRMHFNSLVL